MFLGWAVDPADGTIRNHVALLRQAYSHSHDAYARAFSDLLGALSRRGLFVCHSVVAALGTRILKPGSNERTDRMLYDLIVDWRRLEDRLQIDIDARIFAYLHSGNNTLDQALGNIVGDAIEVDRRQWRFGALMSLLWPRGHAIRGHRLSAYNPFSRLPDSEHDLVRDCLPPGPQVVTVTTTGWRDLVENCLVNNGAVVLHALSEDVGVLRGALLTALAEPVDTGFMLLHPRIIGTDRNDGGISVTLELAERHSMSTTRRIFRSSYTSNAEIRELLELLFTAELLLPSRCLWIISPWLSDLDLLDNRSDAFSSLDPQWGPRAHSPHRNIGASFGEWLASRRRHQDWATQ